MFLTEPRCINSLRTLPLMSPLVIRTYILRLSHEVQFLEAELADLRALNLGQQPFNAATSYSVNGGSHGIDALEETNLQSPPGDASVLDDEVRCDRVICGTLQRCTVLKLEKNGVSLLQCVKRRNEHCPSLPSATRTCRTDRNELACARKDNQTAPSNILHLALRESIGKKNCGLLLRIHTLRSEQPQVFSRPDAFS